MPAWDYDLIIIGGGPAGLTAGIYAGRAPSQNPAPGKAHPRWLATDYWGIFSPDVRGKPWRQVSTAVGDGSVVAISVENYLEELKRG